MYMYFYLFLCYFIQFISFSFLDEIFWVRFDLKKSYCKTLKKSNPKEKLMNEIAEKQIEIHW